MSDWMRVFHRGRQRWDRARGRLRARSWALAHRNVTLGHNVMIGRWCRLIVEPTASIHLGDGVALDDGVTVAALGRGSIRLAEGVFIGHHVTLAAKERLVIGRRTFVAELASVRDHDHDPDHPPASGRDRVGPVLIGDDVWLASKVTVLRGVNIGDRAVVAANAVVGNDVAADTVVGGIPARLLRTKASPPPEQP